VAADQEASQLREHGVALVRDVFLKPWLCNLRQAATRCFEEIECDTSLAQHYAFNPFSHSVILPALADFGAGDPGELLAPLNSACLHDLISQSIDCEWTCRMEQSWVRKKFAPGQAPSRVYQPQNWHQDGALGVRFPSEPGPVIPMTKLLTCWIPLDDCGRDSPGLEFVWNRQSSLLHFTELDDASLRRRFPPEEFWAPVLKFGDALIFLNGTLHRTYARPEMRHNRLSVEYRIFPAEGDVHTTETCSEDAVSARNPSSILDLISGGVTL